MRIAVAPSVFVTGMPRTATAALASFIADQLSLPLVQLGRLPNFRERYMRHWQAGPPSPFGHTEIMTFTTVAIMRLIKRGHEQKVIEGAAVLSVSEMLLKQGHAIALVEPPDLETYVGETLDMARRVETADPAFDFETSHLHATFDKKLHDYFAPQAKRLLELHHPRVIAYKYGEWYKCARRKLSQLEYFTHGTLAAIGGGIGE